MNDNYSIVKSQFPIFGTGGHNVIVALDPRGNQLGEINGEAMSADGKTVKPIGFLRSDRLKVNSYANKYYRPEYSQTTLFTGSRDEVMDRMRAAQACGKEINDLNLPYPFLGFGKNSNSVFSTLAACMGLEDKPLPKSMPVTPGEGQLLLQPETIDSIRRAIPGLQGEGAFPQSTFPPPVGDLPGLGQAGAGPSYPDPQLLASALASPTLDDDLARFALQNAPLQSAQAPVAAPVVTDSVEQSIAPQFSYSPTTAAYAKLLAGPQLVLDLG